MASNLLAVPPPIRAKVRAWLESQTPPGQRNGALFYHARLMNDFFLRRDVAEEILVPKALGDGLSEAEARTTIFSAYRQKPNPSGRSESVDISAGLDPVLNRIAPAEPLPPQTENPAEAVEMIRALFEPGESVCVCLEPSITDGEPHPNAGDIRPKADWIEALIKTPAPDWKGFNPAFGGSVRVCPGGSKTAQVTAYRHALIEADNTPLERQWQVLRAAGLPLSALVHSGNKSLHAVVKVDAPSLTVHRSRVEYLHQFFNRLGVEVDPATKDPVRYARLPGVPRGDRWQYALPIPPGADSWDSWIQYAEGLVRWVERESWPDPHPLPGGLPEAPEADLSLAPAGVRDWLLDMAETNGYDPAFLLAGWFTLASGAIGGKARIQPRAKGNWSVVPNLWGIGVLPPGTRKSSALEALARLPQALDNEDFEVWLRAKREYDIELEGWRAQKTKLLKEGVSAREIAESEPTPPPRPQRIVGDVTAQKLAVILEDNPAGVTVWRDELTGLFASFGTQSQESARAFYLETWAGDSPVQFQRMSRDDVRIPRGTVALFGGTQPRIAADWVESCLAVGDGLAERFQLVAFPATPKAPRLEVDRPPNLTAQRQAETALRRLYALPPDQTYRFNAEAQARFESWYKDNQARVFDEEESSPMRGHLAKFPSLVPSLALIIHLAPGGSGEVGLDSLEAAISLAKHFEGHARRLYALGESKRLTPAESLLNRIMEATRAGRMPSEFTQRDVVRHGWRGFDNPQTVRECLDLLEACYWVRSAEKKPERGRPSIIYALNPKALDPSPAASVEAIAEPTPPAGPVADLDSVLEVEAC